MKKKSKESSENASLAMAYGMRRKSKKASPSKEERPMPEQRHNDSKDVAQADHQRDNKQSGWTDTPVKAQAVMNNGRMVKPIKHPSMAQSPVFKTKFRDEEDHLEESARPDGYGRKPSQDLNEEESHKSGKSPHKMKMMANGGMINEEESFKDAEEDEEQHPAHEESDDDSQRPPEDEIMADHFAEGGSVEEEMAIDHAASIAAAIMAKRKMMAEGGEVDLDLNADEEPNHEDEESFEALKKENYDESDALDSSDQPEDSNEHSPEHKEEDVDDRSLSSRIRRKMKKSPISR